MALQKRSPAMELADFPEEEEVSDLKAREADAGTLSAIRNAAVRELASDMTHNSVRNGIDADSLTLSDAAIDEAIDMVNAGGTEISRTVRYRMRKEIRD